jgi:hypothetical protein
MRLWNQRYTAVALLGAASALAVAAPARAQAQGEAAPAEHTAAQDAHRRALELFDRGRYAEALTEFQRAYALAPSFRIQYNIGLCHAALGDAAHAVEAFDSYLHEGAERIPGPRRTQVESEVTRLSKQLASLQLEVEETGSDVTLDGAPLGTGPLSRQLRLNQGKHTVSVRSPDGTLKTQTVQLAGGQEQRLHFDAAHTPSTPAVPPRAADTPPPQSRPVPWLAWGISGALGAATAVTGVLALSARGDERDAKARQGVTHDELVNARDKVSSLALATDVLLAGTAVAAGVSLYLTLKPEGSHEPTTALVVGPRSLQLRGRF